MRRRCPPPSALRAEPTDHRGDPEPAYDAVRRGRGRRTGPAAVRRCDPGGRPHLVSTGRPVRIPGRGPGDLIGIGLVFFRYPRQPRELELKAEYATTVPSKKSRLGS